MEAKELLALDHDTLLQFLGEELSKDSRRMFPLSPRELIDRAREWITSHADDLRQLVCTNEHIRQLHNAREPQEVMFHALCEVLVGYLTGAHLGFLVAYLLKKGLDNFCHGIWRSSG